MNKLIRIALLGCVISGAAIAHECGDDKPQLVDLLNLYSQQHGTKFVIDPRVRARVNMVGIDSENIEATVLIGILNLHGFTALTPDDEVVYVMPDVVAEMAADKYGREWEG